MVKIYINYFFILNEPLQHHINSNTNQARDLWIWGILGGFGGYLIL